MQNNVFYKYLLQSISFIQTFPESRQTKQVDDINKIKVPISDCIFDDCLIQPLYASLDLVEQVRNQELAPLDRGNWPPLL